MEEARTWGMNVHFHIQNMLDREFALINIFRARHRARLIYWWKREGFTTPRRRTKDLLDVSSAVEKKILLQISKYTSHDGYDLEDDHMHPVSKHRLLQGETSAEEKLYVVFALWNLIPTAWGKNAAKGNDCIFHAFVDKTNKFKFYFLLSEGVTWMHLVDLF